MTITDAEEILRIVTMYRTSDVGQLVSNDTDRNN
ncbi:hypothetical protein FHT76_006614 [Rhizobium sp. BK176]|nr:hypothetical protein [Rhizobium sp. BK181]MCS4094905.1 hypothetical protein [Rhizobium sp. BK176]